MRAQGVRTPRPRRTARDTPGGLMAGRHDQRAAVRAGPGQSDARSQWVPGRRRQLGRRQRIDGHGRGGRRAADGRAHRGRARARPRPGRRLEHRGDRAAARHGQDPGGDPGRVRRAVGRRRRAVQRGHLHDRPVAQGRGVPARTRRRRGEDRHCRQGCRHDPADAGDDARLRDHRRRARPRRPARGDRTCRRRELQPHQRRRADEPQRHAPGVCQRHRDPARRGTTWTASPMRCGRSAAGRRSRWSRTARVPSTRCT